MLKGRCTRKYKNEKDSVGISGILQEIKGIYISELLCD